MEQLPSPPDSYQEPEQYQQTTDFTEARYQRSFLTEDEERELACSTNRQERRRIQNRVAQRAYRQKQKRRLQELEERLTNCQVEVTPHSLLPKIDIESLKASEDINVLSTCSWSNLAITYPIATTVSRRVSRSPPTRSTSSTLIFEPQKSESRGYSPSQETIGPEQSSPASSNFTLPGRYTQQPRPIYAVGYIQPASANAQVEVAPFWTISIIPIRIAVLMNLEVLGVRLEQYQPDDATSTFLPGHLWGLGERIPVEAVISNLFARAADLVPTRLQLEVKHHPYVDIIPSRGIRDRILEALFSEAIYSNQEELCRDIEWGGVRVWGKTPWDGRCWEWSAGFVEKWMWMFEEETLEATNFWRAQRGEALIKLVHIDGEENSNLVTDMVEKGECAEYGSSPGNFV